MQFGVLGAAFVAIGLLGVSGVLGTPFSSTHDSETLSTSIPMMGHVSMTLYDADGNIKKYVQTDNRILNQGDDCMSDLIFDVQTGSACTRPTQKFDIIAIGTGGATTCTTPPDPPDDTTSALTTEITSGGGERVNATTATLTGTTGAATQASMLVEETFTFTAGFTVDEAGVFNAANSASDDALAIQCFTGIPVSNTDTLKVSWTFTVGAT